jgi:hypothetical protein
MAPAWSHRRARENEGVVAGDPNGPVCIVETLPPDGIQRSRPTVQMELIGAHRRQSESRTVARIAGDCLIEQIKLFVRCLLRHRDVVLQRTQIKVVGSQVIAREAGRPRGLGGLQCGLDHPGNADRYLVLKFEHVFERAIEAAGPEMRAALRVDQLRGNADPAPALAHQSLEQ